MQGTISEFRYPPVPDGDTPTGDVDWAVNGLWAFITASGLVLTSVALTMARSYGLGRCGKRGCVKPPAWAFIII